MNGTTQCSGDDSSPYNVTNITRAVERYHSPTACRGGNLPPATLQIQPVRLNGTTQCSGDDSSPCNVANITCVDKTEPPPDMSPRGSECESRDLPKLQIFTLRRLLLQLAKIPPLRFAAVGMTYLGGASVYPHRLFLQRSRNGTQAVPYGFTGRWILSTTQVIIEAWRAAGCRPYDEFVPV